MILSGRAFAEWNSRISLACNAVGQTDFPALITESMRVVTDFQISMTFAYGVGNQVRCLDHNMSESKATIVVHNYMTGPYLLDPFYQEVLRGRTDGSCFLSEISPDRFYSSDYFKHHYARTEIGDEVGIFFPISNEETAVFSFTRPNRQQRFNASERRRIAAVVPLVRSLFIQHFAILSLGEKDPRLPVTARSMIESAFGQFGNDLLTDRESQIASLILKGHSTNSISSHLKISVETVKSHRKNTYAKLNISSQAELFSIFLSSLETL
tara:strand:+ start:34 stop:837 length:804 start_codon:yes stop_codon:yes gene_type:complete